MSLIIGLSVVIVAFDGQKPRVLATGAKMASRPCLSGPLIQSSTGRLSSPCAAG
ncbi:MAG: hypothetical protein AAF331_15460 [Pseudomonadota bacterium]